MAIADFASYLGLQVSGDIGPLTIYTDKYNQKIPFPKSPPKHPVSINQLLQRSRFAQAQRWWKDQTAAVKANYETLALKGGLAMTGQNLAIHVALKNDSEFLKTLMRQQDITVPIPPFITGAA